MFPSHRADLANGDLPSIDYAQPLNQTRIVDLRGLASKEHACQVTARLLEGKRPSGAKPPTALHPFDPNVLELVRQACDGNPRKFLEMLDTRRSERGGDGLVPEAVIAPCTKISKAAPISRPRQVGALLISRALLAGGDESLS